MGFKIKGSKLTYKTQISRINPINDTAKNKIKEDCKKHKRGKV